MSEEVETELENGLLILPLYSLLENNYKNFEVIWRNGPFSC